MNFLDEMWFRITFAMEKVLYGLHRANNIHEKISSEIPISVIPLLIPLPSFTEKLKTKMRMLKYKK